jgi:glycerol-1-phosphate dehydrogenase [NAD(P)+]
LGTAIADRVVVSSQRYANVPEAPELMRKIEEAVKLGASIPRMIGLSKEDIGFGRNAMFTLQERALGKNITNIDTGELNVSTGFLKATNEQIDRTLKLASGILERNEESVKTLMEALVIIGILMSFAGSSRPASGSEHHLSHFFEITGIIDNTEYFPHGIDVAYSTVVTAEIREKILANKFPSKIFREKRENYETKMKSVYKQVADGCVELQDKVGNYANDRINIYLEKEKEIIKILEKMPASEDIYDMLSLVGLDMNEFYSLYDKEKIEKAVLYAKDLKDRYTVLWINYDFYGDEKNV